MCVTALLESSLACWGLTERAHLPSTQHLSHMGTKWIRSAIGNLYICPFYPILLIGVLAPLSSVGCFETCGVMFCLLVFFYFIFLLTSQREKEMEINDERIIDPLPPAYTTLGM